MRSIVLSGLNGANPLGFLAALGLLRLMRQQNSEARLGFFSDGSFQPFVEGFYGSLPALVTADAARAAGKQAWSLEYEKPEKRGVKVVADLKARPNTFLSPNSKCNTTGPDGLRCCHVNQILSTHDGRRT